MPFARCPHPWFCNMLDIPSDNHHRIRWTKWLYLIFIVAALSHLHRRSLHNIVIQRFLFHPYFESLVLGGSYPRGVSQSSHAPFDNRLGVRVAMKNPECVLPSPSSCEKRRKSVLFRPVSNSKKSLEVREEASNKADAVLNSMQSSSLSPPRPPSVSLNQSGTVGVGCRLCLNVGNFLPRTWQREAEPAARLENQSKLDRLNVRLIQ